MKVGGSYAFTAEVKVCFQVNTVGLFGIQTIFETVELGKPEHHDITCFFVKIIQIAQQ